MVTDSSYSHNPYEEDQFDEDEQYSENPPYGQSSCGYYDERDKDYREPSLDEQPNEPYQFTYGKVWLESVSFHSQTSTPSASNAKRRNGKHDQSSSRYYNPRGQTTSSRKEEKDLVLRSYKRGVLRRDVTLIHGTELEKGPRLRCIIAGRSPKCDLVFRHPNIHDYHFKLVIERDSRKMWVSNETKRGSLQVAGYGIKPRCYMQIYPGEILKLGDISRDYKLEWVTPISTQTHLSKSNIKEECVEARRDVVLCLKENKLQRSSNIPSKVPSNEVQGNQPLGDMKCQILQLQENIEKLISDFKKERHEESKLVERLDKKDHSPKKPEVVQTCKREELEDEKTQEPNTPAKDRKIVRAAKRCNLKRTEGTNKVQPAVEGSSLNQPPTKIQKGYHVFKMKVQKPKMKTRSLAKEEVKVLLTSFKKEALESRTPKRSENLEGYNQVYMGLEWHEMAELEGLTRQQEGEALSTQSKLSPKEGGTIPSLEEESIEEVGLHMATCLERKDLSKEIKSLPKEGGALDMCAWADQFLKSFQVTISALTIMNTGYGYEKEEDSKRRGRIIILSPHLYALEPPHTIQTKGPTWGKGMLSWLKRRQCNLSSPKTTFTDLEGPGGKVDPKATSIDLKSFEEKKNLVADQSMALTISSLHRGAIEYQYMSKARVQARMAFAPGKQGPKLDRRRQLKWLHMQLKSQLGMIPRDYGPHPRHGWGVDKLSPICRNKLAQSTLQEYEGRAWGQARCKEGGVDTSLLRARTSHIGTSTEGAHFCCEANLCVYEFCEEQAGATPNKGKNSREVNFRSFSLAFAVKALSSGVDEKLREANVWSTGAAATCAKTPREAITLVAAYYVLGKAAKAGPSYLIKGVISGPAQHGEDSAMQPSPAMGEHKVTSGSESNKRRTRTSAKTDLRSNPSRSGSSKRWSKEEGSKGSPQWIRDPRRIHAHAIEDRSKIHEHEIEDFIWDPGGVPKTILLLLFNERNSLFSLVEILVPRASLEIPALHRSLHHRVKDIVGRTRGPDAGFRHRKDQHRVFFPSALPSTTEGCRGRGDKKA
ncbi:hypothetical protein EJ110_NYTH21167 [Nymphaea thermarum]|nr:hypothetical protein EJ110_NYTH21167 [Nymphaea thermarum]